ncbi:CarD family transcriptional regulator [Georgenia sunbinii]|uniref:CarD family transcriptional regulator n=1 Tax=Georgenia sunbinii TaxID=3117728 RepID=UPI002F26B758
MNFSTGQVVVHPHHGPATIKKIFTRTIRDDRRKYLNLEVRHSDLSVAVPVELAEEMGVRPILDAAGVREIFDLLLAESEVEETVWSRRIKNNTMRLRSGDVRTIAGLIRDLTRRNTEKRLSFGEMNLLRDAMTPFVAELAISLNLTEDDVTAMVDAAVLENKGLPASGVELAPAV